MAIEDGPFTQTSADAACFTPTLTGGSNRTDVAAVLNGAGHLLSADAACDPRPGNVAKVDAVFNGAGGIDLAANAAGVYDTTTVRNVGFVGAVLDGTVFG